MIDPMPTDKLNAWDGVRSDLTPWTFMRAAGLANLIVATAVFAEFSGLVGKVEDGGHVTSVSVWRVLEAMKSWRLPLVKLKG